MAGAYAGRMTDPVLIGPVDAPELHAMTYNVRRPIRNLRPGSPDRWARRKWLMRRILAAELPTVLGVQEAFADQVHFVAESLGAHYRWVGLGRNASGEGERCAVFYDSGRLILSEWKQRALSATPDTPGSRSWGNITPRVVVIAHFTDATTGRRLIVFNFHLDHVSRRSRFASARMIRQLAVTERLMAINRWQAWVLVATTAVLWAAVPFGWVELNAALGAITVAFLAAAAGAVVWSRVREAGLRREREHCERLISELRGPG